LLWPALLKQGCSTDWATAPLRGILCFILLWPALLKQGCSTDWATAPCLSVYLPAKRGNNKDIWVLDKSFEFFVYFRRYLYSHCRTIFKLNLLVYQVWLECSFASTHWVRSSISWFSSLTCEVTYSCHQSKENI